MQTDISAVEDVVSQVSYIVGSLDGKGARIGGCGLVLLTEGSVLLADVSLRAEVLYVPSSAGGLHERPVLRELVGILSFAGEDIGSEVLVNVFRVAHVLDAVVLPYLRFGKTAQLEHVSLHFLHRVVLCESDAPVATCIALTGPLVERRAIVAEVQANGAREVIFLREVDVGVVRSVVRTELDVDGVGGG